MKEKIRWSTVIPKVLLTLMVFASALNPGKDLVLANSINRSDANASEKEISAEAKDEAKSLYDLVISTSEYEVFEKNLMDWNVYSMYEYTMANAKQVEDWSEFSDGTVAEYYLSETGECSQIQLYLQDYTSLEFTTDKTDWYNKFRDLSGKGFYTCNLNNYGNYDTEQPFPQYPLLCNTLPFQSFLSSLEFDEYGDGKYGDCSIKIDNNKTLLIQKSSSTIQSCTNYSISAIDKKKNTCIELDYSAVNEQGNRVHAIIYAQSMASGGNDDPDDKLSVSESEIELNVGQKTTLHVYDSKNKEVKDVAWTSGNMDVATVNSKGVVTAVAPGSATITASTKTGLSASCKVTVVDNGEPVPEPEKKYKITYVLNGGENNPGNPSSYDKPKKAIKIKDASRAGYTFKGWYQKKNFKGKKFKKIKKGSKKNLTLYAKWEANTYSVVFDPNGGQGSMNQLDCVYDKSMALPANTFTNGEMIFSGWNTERNGFGETFSDGQEIVNLSADDKVCITLYAQWKRKDAISFDANGGTGTMEPVYKDSVIPDMKIPTNKFSKPGWTFVRWSTQPNGGGHYYYEWEPLNKVFEENVGMDEITLYPVWVRFYSGYPSSPEYNSGDWPNGYNGSGCVAASNATAVSTILGTDIKPVDIMVDTVQSMNAESIVNKYADSGLGKLYVEDSKDSLDECLQRYLQEPDKYAPPVITCSAANHTVVIVGRYSENEYMCIDSSGYTAIGEGGKAVFRYESSQSGGMNKDGGGMHGNVDLVWQFINTWK